MPDRPYQQCRECGARTRGPYCETHVNNNAVQRSRATADRERKKGDPIWKLYNRAVWHRFRASFLSCNPICQRILEDGKQCREGATIVHHLTSPRVNASLMYTFGNCKGVCEQHHPTSEGEPVENLDRLDQVYVTTKVPVIRF